MKHLPLYKRLLCLLLCLSVIPAAALPVYAKPILPTFISTVPVYYRASSDSTVIGYLPEDTSLTVLDRQGQYYQIDCYDMVGFIPAAYVGQQGNKYYVNLPARHAELHLFMEHPIGSSIVLRRQLYTHALKQVGVPYVSGGTSPRGFDCSGFTQYIYKQLGISIPRTCDAQLSCGIIIPKENLQCGDLVLFQRTTSHRSISTHVGIYLGDGKLIHAGSRGITVADLDSAYFAQHYLCARRIILSAKPSFTTLSVASYVRSGTKFQE